MTLATDRHLPSHGLTTGREITQFAPITLRSLYRYIALSRSNWLYGISRRCASCKA